MSAPLSGIRVVDMTRILAGPWCTQLLGDLGAEVIKIEQPGKGDDTRKWGPPWLKTKEGSETGDAAYFLAANRNKASVTLDIKTSDGLAALKELVAQADVFVENFKVGGLAQYGLDWASLQPDNPGLVYLSITGFGQTGPMAEQPGYDYLIQGLSGIMSITGNADGNPGAGPQRVGVAVSDLTTGMYATIGILSALYQRRDTGKGQYIDLALLDTQVGWLANQAMNYFVSGNVPERTGSYHPNLAPYQPFRTRDSSIIIAVGNDSQFGKLCALIGLDSLIDDARFVTNADRVKHRSELEQYIAPLIEQEAKSHWLQVLPVNGVPCSAINTIAEAFAQEQIQHRGMEISLPHAMAGEIAGVGNPLNFSDAEVQYRSAPPVLGNDTERILNEWLGYDQNRIDEMKKSGAT
ncbi:MAG: CaiB/BaiF CoA-transferase family protein [Pseudomonadota bacterium]